MRRWRFGVYGTISIVVIWLSMLIGGLGTRASTEYPWPQVTRPGIYLAYDYQGHDPDTFATVGALAAFYWADLEPERGLYTFDVIDHWLGKLAARGLKGAFFVAVLDGGCGGDRALPSYIRADPQLSVRRSLGYTCEETGRTWKALPYYISPAFQARYRELIYRLGTRYKNDPRVEFIAIGTGIYGETRAAAEWADREALVQAGLTMDNWIAFCKQVTDWHLEAFSDSQGRLLKPLLQQPGAITFHPRERQIISQYSVERGVGLSPNLMFADGEGVLFGDASVCPMCGWYDYPLRYWQVVPTAWEAYELHTCTPVLTWWGVYNILDKHPTYLRLAAPMVRDADGNPRSQNLQPFRWAAPFFGVTATTAPSAWVALREHRDPFYPYPCVNEDHTLPHRYPQWGNYRFFLDQVDALPGGHTVPETNDPRVQRMGTNLAPYNPLLPPGKEGWATRRTDYVNGNPYMFFALDNDFVQGVQSRVEVRITYWDYGHDRWTLRYLNRTGELRQAHTAEGSTYIQKTDSRQWKTVTLYMDHVDLSDGLPQGHGGADFYIDSLNDGDEWIHFVEVIRTWGITPPHPLPPPVITTPTPLPTPTPHPRALIAPHNSQGVVIDGDLSEWGAPLAVLSATTAETFHGDRARADARVLFWSTWNDQGLAMAFRVYDDQLKGDSVYLWKDDSIEIGLDANHDHRFTWNGADFQFTVDIWGRWARMGTETPDPHISRTVRRLADGWTVEILFPWSVLRIPPGTPGRILGFTFAYHDDDDGGNWDTYMIWAGTRTNTSDAQYGHLLLGNTGGTVPPPQWITPQPPVYPTPNCYRKITGRVFWDTNADGRWTPNEPGIPGLAVLLNGPVSLMTNTREDGSFTFVGLPQGSYQLAATVPEGKHTSTPNPQILAVPGPRCSVLTDINIGVVP